MSRRPTVPRALAGAGHPGLDGGALGTAGEASPRGAPEAAGRRTSSARRTEEGERARAGRRGLGSLRVRRGRPASRPERGSSPVRPERRARVRAEDPGPEKPPRTVTMRTMVLALVVLVAFIVLTPTARAFIAQTEQQRRVEAEHAAVEVDVERLEGELGRWADPSYVQAQARQRLAWVMPGEVPFRVVDPETVPVADGGGYANLEESVQSAPQVPWYLTLRESVVEAGRPTGEEEAATVPVIRP